MRASGCDVSVLVNGLSGLTARDMVAKAKHPTVPDCTGKVGKGLDMLLNQKPDLVMIMAGTNDLGMGVSPQAILADVVRLHKACHARSIPTVALAPSTVAQGPSTMGRQQLASLLRKWAKTTPSVTVCIDMMELIPLGCNRLHCTDVDQYRESHLNVHVDYGRLYHHHGDHHR